MNNLENEAMERGRMNYPKVSIIVLNWNGREHVLECLESLYQITYPNYNVILVDNGSQDGSVEKITQWADGKIPVESKLFKCKWEAKLRKLIEYQRNEALAGGGRENEIDDLTSDKGLIIIKNDRNYGYGGGNNVGIEYAFKALNPEYILLLHFDAVVAPDFLDQLVKVAKEEPKAGILGAKIYCYEEPGRIWFSGGKINYWKGTFYMGREDEVNFSPSENAYEVDYVVGVCMLLSRDVCQTVGLLDEIFFIGIEELDISIRAAKGGFKILFVPKSKVWHNHFRADPDGKRLENRLYFVTKDQFILLGKNWGKFQLISATLYCILCCLKGLNPLKLHSHKWRYTRVFLKGMFDFLKWKLKIQK